MSAHVVITLKTTGPEVTLDVPAAVTSGAVFEIPYVAAGPVLAARLTAGTRSLDLDVFEDRVAGVLPANWPGGTASLVVSDAVGNETTYADALTVDAPTLGVVGAPGVPRLAAARLLPPELRASQSVARFGSTTAISSTVPSGARSAVESTWSIQRQASRRPALRSDPPSRRVVPTTATLAANSTGQRSAGLPVEASWTVASLVNVIRTHGGSTARRRSEDDFALLLFLNDL